MNYLVVDDEPMALDYMKEMVEEVTPGSSVYATSSLDEIRRLMSTVNFDAIFLDIHMPHISGVDLARELKMDHPKLNIIFTTGYSEYMGDAFDLDASAYLMKPVTSDRVAHALENLRYTNIPVADKKVVFHCFGNFEVFVEGQPVQFGLLKTKELLAYLVHRNGASCTVAEIAAVLWEDESHESYFRKLKKDLMDTLRALGADDIIYSSRGYIGLRVGPDIACDYYSWLKGEPAGINAYCGEYMAQYSWGEFTNANIQNSTPEKNGMIVD